MFLRERLAREGEVLHGVLAAIPSAVATQAIAAAGADFILIDREHAPIGREAMHAMIAATAGTACGALVRVPGIDEAEVKVALDAARAAELTARGYRALLRGIDVFMLREGVAAFRA